MQSERETGETFFKEYVLKQQQRNRLQSMPSSMDPAAKLPPAPAVEVSKISSGIKEVEILI